MRVEANSAIQAMGHTIPPKSSVRRIPTSRAPATRNATRKRKTYGLNTRLPTSRSIFLFVNPHVTITFCDGPRLRHLPRAGLPARRSGGGRPLGRPARSQHHHHLRVPAPVPLDRSREPRARAQGGALLPPSATPGRRVHPLRGRA